MADKPQSQAGAQDEVVVHTINPGHIPSEEPERSDLKAAEPVPAPNSSNLPSATSKVAKQAANEWGLFVVDAEQDGPSLFITVEGNHIEDVTGTFGRRLAYDSRFHYGWGNSGIEPHGGPNLVKGSTEYRQTWRLTRTSI